MGDNRGSYLVKALLDNYEEPLDISLISNNPFIPSIGNNLNTSTNQNNEKRHLLPESTPNLPPNLNKSIQEMESFIDQKCNELALGSLKRDAEIKQQISQELEAHYNTSLVKSLKDQIDILQSEVYFLREELREKNNLFKILMKSKISDNKCHNIATNNQNDKIPESAPSELRHTTTNKNNHKNIGKNETDEKINNDNTNNSMANNINFDSGSKNNNKNNGNKNKGNCINSNEGNSNSNNNNNSSSKENNMSSSNINSKISIKNINNNSKKNNINSNGGDNSTSSK